MKDSSMVNCRALPGRNCLTRIKQCEVVLKISTETLERKEKKEE